MLGSAQLYAQTTIFSADFETLTGDNNWIMQGGATDGDWIMGTPTPYTTNGIQMEISAFQGSRDLVTGENFSQDVDGGPTRARSQNITLPQGTITIDFEYYFSYYTNSSTSDHFFFDIRRSSDNALLRRIVNERGSSAGLDAAWIHVTDDLSAFAGQDIYIRVQSRDISNGSKVEAAVDQIVITGQSPNNVAGTVFDDIDTDGEFGTGESGIPGVTVTLFDNTGQVGQTTTDASGAYSFSSVNQGTPYQIVFSNWPSGFQESVLGTDNNGSVQLVSAGDTNESLGLYAADLTCASDPFMVIPCYVEGPNSSVATEPAIVKVRSSADGHDFTGTSYNAGYQGIAIADYAAVGTVYGVAWQATQKRIYTSAFHKRYASYGPSGADAIYQMDLDGNITGVISMDGLIGITNSTGGDVHDFTTVVNGQILDLGSGDQSFDAVGKRGMGDIEMSGDNNTLYIVNLFDRKIYALDVSSGSTASTTISASWLAPDETSAGRHRPFGLAWHDDQLWIGSVDENGSNAFVHSLDVATGVFSLELTIPLQFDRQSFFGLASNTVNAPARWNAWQTNTNFNPYDVSSEIGYPQPMLSDIEFATDGSMIIGFRDRFGDQSGAGKYFASSSTNLTWAISQGDILKACNSATGFDLESGASGDCPAPGNGFGNSGPGGQEFYYWDFFEVGTGLWDPSLNDGGFHWETSQGGLLQIEGADYIISTAMDPINDFSGGYVKFNNNNGSRQGVSGPTTAANLVGGYTIYEAGDYNNALPPNNGFAAKANGLGDIEAACVSYITIGNFVWYDANGDGIQDPDDPGLAQVTVELYKDDVLVGQVTTDAGGYYFFGGPSDNGLFNGSLLANTEYDIRINISSAQANDGSVTSIGGVTLLNATNDQLDSDGMNQGSYSEVTFVTGTDGTTDYSFDFGFSDCTEVSSTNEYEGCIGDGYESFVGTSTYNEANPSGVDTLVSSFGCDSIVSTMMAFLPNGGSGYLNDTMVCKPQSIDIDGTPPSYIGSISSHTWTDLGIGTASGYILSNTSSAVITLDASAADVGSVFLQYKAEHDECPIIDTVIIQIFSAPVSEIISDLDTICTGATMTLSALTNYLVQPDSGFIPPMNSGQGFTGDNYIYGIQDPMSTVVKITLPTWDDHFDTMRVNGLMVFPEVFQPGSYNASGMNCASPWVANVNGLPRSIIEISSTQVRYFSSLTSTSTVMTEVFPTSWVTTPQPFVEGTNVIRFGVQNTAGPVSGSWTVEAENNSGYDYLWSTGDTTIDITVNPVTTTTYQLTVTSPTGCSSISEKTIHAGISGSESFTYEGCSGDGYAIEVNGIVFNESNPSDTLVVVTQGGCDSIFYIDLNYNLPPSVEAGGSAAPICSNESLDLATLGASITGGVTTGTWTSTDGGTFDNGGRFGDLVSATTYIPSEAEINGGKIILTLTSDDPPGPCEPDADAIMILINDIRCAPFPWSGGY